MQLLNVFWHSVEPDSMSPGLEDGGNPSEAQFRAQLEFLIERYSPISIAEFVQLLRKGREVSHYSRPPILLGFDDGFRNVLTSALPILEEFQVPALFMVTGENLRNRDFVPWFIEIRHLFRRAERKRITYGGQVYDLRSKQQEGQLRRLVKEAYMASGCEEARERIMNDAAECLGVLRPTAAELDDDLALVSAEDLGKLGSSSLLSIASHAMTHRPLARLTHEEQVHELRQSDRLLRRQCPSYFPIVSYPHGSFNDDTLRIARDTYEAGFAVFLGSSYRSLYAYPRIGLANESRAELSYALSPRRLKVLLPVKRILHVAGIQW